MKAQCRQCFWIAYIVLGFELAAHAADGQGWTFSGRLQGSSNSSGFVTKVDPTIGYKFNRYFQTYSGLPFYFVHEASTTQTSPGVVNGIGNAYAGFRAGIDRPALNFVSNLEVTAPTGDRDKGFSTGRVTADWTNSFSHQFESVTPFASVGVANTIADTSFFIRPFSSLGLVSHFDGGATFNLGRLVDVGASAYGVRASGEQRIISKVKERGSLAASATSSQGTGSKRFFETSAETVGSADLANDHGLSTWFAVHPSSNVDFQVGYTRSMGYDLNTLFFGVGFRVGN